MVKYNPVRSWSGTQSKYKTLPDRAIQNIKKDFLDKPTIIYRYCKDLLQKAIEIAVYFDYTLNAFKKRGKDLTDDETDSIIGIDIRL